MDYQLALAPDLGLSPADFVAVWNVTIECRTAAEAHLLSQKHHRASSTTPSSELVVLKGRVDLAITTHIIENLVKEVLKREGVRRVTITYGKVQDDTQLLTVSSDEK